MFSAPHVNSPKNKSTQVAMCKRVIVSILCWSLCFAIVGAGIIYLPSVHCLNSGAGRA